MAKGVNFLIYAQTGTDSTTGDPILSKVGGQRGGTFNREAETLDLTSKDNYGWSDADYGVASWSIEGDGLLVENDAGYLALEDAFDTKTAILVRWETEAGNQYEGNAIITSFPIEAGYNENATYSVTLTGKGQYTKTVA